MKTILIVFSLLFILTFVSEAQDKQNNTEPDSVNILVFQNKYSPEKIEILKAGRRVHLKLGRVHNKIKKYSIRGKLTSITDTMLVVDNLYRVKFSYDSISDYRFNIHPFQKFILGTAGLGVFLFGLELAVGASVVLPELPGVTIFFASIGVIGDVIIYKALTKKKHPVNSWNVSIKKMKRNK